MSIAVATASPTSGRAISAASCATRSTSSAGNRGLHGGSLPEEVSGRDARQMRTIMGPAAAIGGPNDGSGAPPNVDYMKRESQVCDGLSVLSLEFQADEARPDWPVVGIKVDGDDPFVEVAKDWRGFDPAKMLGSASPLLPGDLGRRVALYTCSCGESGCGVIAPFVVPSPDGRRISWVEFRDYVGVFVGPLVEDSHNCEGKPWRLTDLQRRPVVGDVAAQDRAAGQAAARRHVRGAAPEPVPYDGWRQLGMRTASSSPSRRSVGRPSSGSISNSCA